MMEYRKKNKLEIGTVTVEQVAEWIKANNQPLAEQPRPKISKDLNGGSIDFPAKKKIIEETKLTGNKEVEVSQYCTALNSKGKSGKSKG